MKQTSINDVILAVVTDLGTAVTYPVFDGPPSNYPHRNVDRYVTVGAEEIDDQTNPTGSAEMEAEWHGLGQRARTEQLRIPCVALGKAKSIRDARAIAMQVIEDVGAALPICPTAETYGAQISAVSGVRSHNVTGGAIVQIQFTISASARLT